MQSKPKTNRLNFVDFSYLMHYLMNAFVHFKILYIMAIG